MKKDLPAASIAHLLVLGGLYFLNTLIVLFGSPYLIYKKLEQISTIRKCPNYFFLPKAKHN